MDRIQNQLRCYMGDLYLDVKLGGFSFFFFLSFISLYVFNRLLKVVTFLNQRKQWKSFRNVLTQSCR